VLNATAVGYIQLSLPLSDNIKFLQSALLVICSFIVTAVAS